MGSGRALRIGPLNGSARPRRRQHILVGRVSAAQAGAQSPAPLVRSDQQGALHPAIGATGRIRSYFPAFQRCFGRGAIGGLPLLGDAMQFIAFHQASRSDAAKAPRRHPALKRAVRRLPQLVLPWRQRLPLTASVQAAHDPADHPVWIGRWSAANVLTLLAMPAKARLGLGQQRLNRRPQAKRTNG